jgi:hypothetical protein
MSHRCVFRLALALSAGGLALTAATVITSVASVHHASGGSAEVVLAGVKLTYPSVNGAGAVLLVIGMLGAGVMAVALRGAWRQLRTYRRFVAALGSVGSLPRDPRVNVIADARPQAFCAGYLRPAVYVSRQTVALLSEAELDAVLAHEHHHRRVRDPLRIACARILSEALFFLPVLKALSDRYADVAELSADRAAVRACADGEAALASALLAFDEVASPGVSGISPERVDSLLGEPPSWHLPEVMLAASFGVLPALGVVVWLTSQSAAAYATFNLPILSSRPCLMLVTLLANAGWVAMLVRRVRVGRPAS